AALAAVPAPMVAVIAGPASGPAWELALACDLRLAAADAEIGSPEVRWGRIPSAGGTQRLVRAVGLTQALELLLLGQTASGAEAAPDVHRQLKGQTPARQTISPAAIVNRVSLGIGEPPSSAPLSTTTRSASAPARSTPRSRMPAARAGAAVIAWSASSALSSSE